MTNRRTIFAAAIVCALALLPASLSAQTISPTIILAGASSIFNAVGYSAFQQNAGGFNFCGPNHWTYKSTSGQVVIHDGRSVQIPDENTTIWVSWNGSADGTTTPPTKLCAYLSLDEGIGVRAVFAQPTATVGLTVTAGTAGQNKVPNTTVPDVPLPANIIASLNNQPIQVSVAVVRPEDAKFAVARALTAQGTHVPLTTLTYISGLGYGGVAPSIGYGIKSSQSSAVAIPVDFALYGSDPITGQPALPSFTTIPIGAGPFLIIANTSNSNPGHLGDPNLTDINSATLAGLLDGTFRRTRDISGFYPAESNIAEHGVKVFVREPLAGAFNAVEYNIPANYRFLSTQEKGVVNVAPFPAAQNPLQDGQSFGDGSVGGRFRAVGTSEIISSVKANPDSIGYAAWGFGNFAGITSSQVRYLTVDGVDPLYANANANPNGPGVLPQYNSGTGTYPALPFTNIASGNYPIWSTYRFIVPAGGPLSAANCLANIVQANASGPTPKITEFVPTTITTNYCGLGTPSTVQNMQVFRSHFYQEGIGPENGTRAVPGISPTQYYPDLGGEAGGQVFPLQADYDLLTDANLELLQRHQ